MATEVSDKEDESEISVEKRIDESGLEVWLSNRK